MPSIKEEKEVEEVPPVEQFVLVVPSPVADWREQFIKYLINTKVPANKTDTERLIRRSKHYVLVDGNLMRKSAKEGVLQKCVPQDEGVKLFLKFTLVPAATMWPREPWSAKLSDLVFIGSR